MKNINPKKSNAGKPRNTEVHAYIFIKRELESLGWDTRNPDRVLTGQVYTQNECLGHPEIQKYLKQDRPENIVKLLEQYFWVIEAKKDRNQIDQALQEAEDYARVINESSMIQVKIISGVAGNEIDGFIVESRFFDGKKYRPVLINGKGITGFISPETSKILIQANTAEINDFQVDEALFFSKAERINEILHLGAINKNQRARVIAALLLCRVSDTLPDLNADPTLLINDVNNRVESVLAKEGKPEFKEYLRIALPPTRDNHIKFKRALVQTFQELGLLNIRSAMNSGTDVLGRFYEIFLKYGNGAKEIGIVLTPRNITKFAADVLNITPQDVVFDPTCGTGGFLVAAFDHVKKTCNKQQIEKFKRNNLFGVEQDADVAALAIVNMIFRGDGKNNIIEGNCFQKYLTANVTASGGVAKYSMTPAADGNQPVTKVLMNPPFALKQSDEKEYRFVDHALLQMQDGGILFAILPYSAMVRPSRYFQWRKTNLLHKNTLLSVITLPQDLFYPVGVHTVGVFIKKGIPQPEKQNVLWIRAVNDGLLKSKGKRLPNPKAPNDYERIKDTVRSFLANPFLNIENEEMFLKACPIDFSDSLLELVPENYLDQSAPTKDEIRSGIEQVIRDSVAFLIKSGRDND
jgi:type I restriction-modification system DNA methylase subunit